MRVVIYVLLVASACLGSLAQASTLWQEANSQAKSTQTKKLRAVSSKGRFMIMDERLLNEKFDNVSASTDITLPLPNGSNIHIRLTPSPILADDLAKKFPAFMAYQAREIGQDKNIGRFSISHLGLFGLFRYENQWMLLSPRYQGEAQEYASYWYKDAPTDTAQIGPDSLRSPSILEDPEVLQKLVTSGDKLRTYKLAISTTGEYSQRLGGTVDNVVAELMNLVNRINQILLIDLAIQFELVDNQEIIFLDAASDPFTNSDSATDIETNQQVADDAIGSQNYDIGHVLGTNGGGLAFVGVMCNSRFKAQGYTGLNNPQGERFYIDLVAHEFGHQLGASHSFNATNSASCDEGQRSNSSAYEPGSGSTIMAYAGICAAQNIQNNSDAYFHAASIESIRDHIDSPFRSSCGIETDIQNAIPQIQLADTAYTIPANTPFVLTGTATDANGDPLTYAWEQFDNGGTFGATNSLAELNSDNGSNPLFRSFTPTATGLRYFPQLSDVVRDQTSLGESYATTDRDMLFRLTVRDNKGGVNQQDVAINVTTDIQSFNLNTISQWQGLSEQEVTWDIGDTTNTSISCSNVDILLDTDGSLEFATTLISQASNDGQQMVNVPNVAGDNARLMLICSDNIFYTVSNETFIILEGEPVAPTIDGQTSITLDEDSTRQISFDDINVSDPDSSYPQDFTLTVQAGENYTVEQQTVRPNSNYFGPLTVNILVNDGEQDSNLFALQIQVTPVNDSPIANNDTASIQQNAAATLIDLLANDNDVDGDVLTLDSFSYSGQGIVTQSQGQLSYTPAAGFSGSETISYIITDGALTDEADVTITVNSSVSAGTSGDTSSSGGGGSLYWLSFLSFLCFSVKLVINARLKVRKDSHE